MSAYDKPTDDANRFFAQYFGKNKSGQKFGGKWKPHDGNWTLHYGKLTWPKSTNAPYGVCMSKQKELVQQEGKQEDKFTIKPAS